MGQAQLLLIVLGTVVVGLAVMAGINAYEQNNIKSDLDAVVHECMRLASDAQTAAQKPVAFGGLLDPAENSFDFADQGTNATTLAMLGWNSNGASSTITLGTIATASFVATCTSDRFDPNGDGTNANTATITVTGVGADDIATATTLHTP